MILGERAGVYRRWLPPVEGIGSMDSIAFHFIRVLGANFNFYVKLLKK
jgi:hypothetical protein